MEFDPLWILSHEPLMVDLTFPVVPVSIYYTTARAYATQVRT